ncbi:DUF1919 domain-containing protein [Pectobacterium carotovorum]|uniref:DUF1919 domain-containing protein n=1 Tax=Pectobacterium carotovorum TaxID=554 RepID=UPI0015DDAEDA|nr:DUF1919 domain-containing protein [Pectobacterium carotovorum]MBA0178568.1 DUF1919 domain-containing protein [Pectobacterium carotovorum]
MINLKKIVIKVSGSLAKRLDFIILHKKELCIISNNCWGNKLYEIVNREYNTPFVGLFLQSGDYIKFIKNIEYNVSVEITENHFNTFSQAYPIANIEGCTIHFLHYKDKNEAIEKWNRRRIRLIKYIKDNGVNSLIFKLCDTYCEKHDVAKNEAEFNSLPFERKIFFTTGRKNKILNDGERNLNGPDFFKGRILYYKDYLKLFSNLPSLKKNKTK